MPKEGVKFNRALKILTNKIHTAKQERESFQVNRVTKRKVKSNEILQTLKHGKSAARFVQNMAKWRLNRYAKINSEKEVAYMAQQITSFL